jgi:hypothetical protein
MSLLTFNLCLNVTMQMCAVGLRSAENLALLSLRFVISSRNTIFTLSIAIYLLFSFVYC